MDCPFKCQIEGIYQICQRNSEILAEYLVYLWEGVKKTISYGPVRNVLSPHQKMQNGLKHLFFFMKEKNFGSKGKIFLHIFPCRNILHLFFFFRRKKNYFGYDQGVPPPLCLILGTFEKYIRENILKNKNKKILLKIFYQRK